MDLGWIDIGLKVVTLALSIGAIVVAIVRTRRDHVDKLFEGTHKKLVDLDRRVQRLEDGRANLPTKEELHSIALQLAALNGTIGVIHSEMEGHGRMLSRVEKVVGRHEDHLLNAGKPEKVRG